MTVSTHASSPPYSISSIHPPTTSVTLSLCSRRACSQRGKVWFYQIGDISSGQFQVHCELYPGAERTRILSTYQHTEWHPSATTQKFLCLFQSKTLFRPLQQRRWTGSSELPGCLHKLATHSDPNHDSEIANQLRSVLAFIYRIIYATNISASSERDKSAFKSSKNKVGVLVLAKCKKRQGVIMSLPEKKMIKFHLEKMSSLHITYPFEDYSSPVWMMLPRQRAKGRAGPQVREGSINPYNEKGVTSQLNSLLFKGSTRAECFVKREN